MKNKQTSRTLSLAGKLVAISGLLMIAYGIMFLFKNFSGFIEVGLGPEHAGRTPDEIRAYSPMLFDYISHLHVGIAGLMIGLGMCVAGLGWYGVTAGLRWPVWTALAGTSVAIAIALPLHHVYGMATLLHVGPVYLSLLVLFVGAALAFTRVEH